MNSWPILEAEDTLREFGATMTRDDFFECQLIATGNWDAAERATNERTAAQLRKGEQAE